METEQTEPSSWWGEAGRSLLKCLQSKQREGLAGGGGTSVHTVHSHQGISTSWEMLKLCTAQSMSARWSSSPVHKAAVQCHHHHFQRGTNLRFHLYKSDCEKPLRLARYTFSWYKWTSLYCMVASEATVVCGGF